MTETDTSAQGGERRPRWALLGIGAALVVTAAVAAAAVTAGRTGPGTDDLIQQCRNEVKSHLKAPATAQFTGEKITQLDNNQSRVDGAVDAQNGFGALVRSHYTCTAVPYQNESWTVVEANVSNT